MSAIDSKTQDTQVAKRIITLRITNHVGTPKNRTETDENWKEIGLEYPGYYASSFGRIQGLKGRIFNCKANDHGYVTCGIVNNYGKKVLRSVHVLIATLFIPNPENKPIVNHINGIKHDNRSVNLEWATQSENSGPMKLSKTQGDRRRRIIQYSIEGNPIKVWDSVTEAANTVHVSPTHISGACRGIPSIYRGYKWRYYDEMVRPENEEWRSIVYNGVTIQASDLGRIKSAIGRIVGSETDAGYIIVNIKGITVLAHRLVCLAWKPIECPELFVVNHIDNNGKNNRVDNLEWVTQADNSRHYCEKFLVRGSHNKGRSIKQLSKDDKVVIATFGSAKEACEKTGVSGSNIVQVCQGKRKSAGQFVWQYADVSA